MTRRMTAAQVKANFLSLINEIEGGSEVEITLRGKTVARLTGAPRAKPIAGWLRGVARTNASAEELFSTGEEWNAQ